MAEETYDTENPRESRFKASVRVVTRALAEKSGLQVFDYSFHHPIPNLAVLPDDVFDRVSPLPGIAFDSAAQLAWAERELQPFMAEFGDGPERWARDNPFYETGDAEIAYSFVRHIRPRRIIELGSGYSTLVVAHAVERNRADGDEVGYRAFNPWWPASFAEEGKPPPGLDSHERIPAEEVRLEEFDALESGDILFVDTSHTVKLAGDVNRIVLEVLPRLKPGVWIHFHDIWLPFEYHENLVRLMKLYWNEQYLLQAFLCMNPAFEVVFGTRAVAGQHPEEFGQLVPGFAGSEKYPSSFWLRRVV